MTSKPTRRPFRLEGLAFGEWRLQSTFATREAAVNWLRDRPTRIIDTRTGQDVTVESEPTDDAEARALAAEVAARGYRERAEKAEALIEDMVPKTWDGLLALLDEVYPDDVFPTLPDDPARDAGPRAVSLIRYARRVEAERDALRAERDALAAQVERVRALADVLDSEGRETAALGGVYRQGLGDSACDAAARIRAALDGGE